MGLDHVRSEIEHMRVRSEGSVRKSSSFSAPAYRLHRLSFCLGGCWRGSRAFVTSGTGSRKSRAVRRRGACLAAGVGDARTIEMVRRQGGQLALVDALAELRQRAAREGHCFQHVQAITVAIDQYAEKALGNRDYFLNKPAG
jgi:hypothetical protein